MYILFIIWFILLLIVQIVYLIKSVKRKNNKNWSILFTIISSSILSSVLLWGYSLFNVDNIGWNALLNFILCIVAIAAYIVILLISVLLKIVEVRKNKKINVIKEKIEKKTLIRIVITPFIAITLLSICIYMVDYSKYIIEEKIEIKKYNETKNKKIEEMANFINAKYGTNFTVNDSIYYREEDYSTHTGFLYSETYNIPYISIFENENKKITVVDRKGKISDNGQLENINYYIADYFSKIVGTDIDFVQIRETGNGNIEDDVINKFLQCNFNEKITNKNLNKFINSLFLEENLELIFYIKDNNKRKELINLLTDKLSYLKEYKNIERVMLYIYDRNEELIIKNFEKNLVGDFKYDKLDDDYTDDYKFGYYYVPNDFEYYYPNSESSKFKNENFNTFVASAYYNLNRGYGPAQGNRKYEIINGWYVYTY